MGGEPAALEYRPVLIQTPRGTVEGRVRVNHGVRTLDWLNLQARFVPVEATEIAVRGWSFEPRHLGINKDQIQFIVELGEGTMDPSDRVEATHYAREAVALHVGDCDIQGYMHVRGLHDPLVRFSRSPDEFVAMTSASVVGPDFELAATFLAIHPAHVLGVQSMEPAAGQCAFSALAKHGGW